jgi:hypothetical protein
MKRTQDNLAHFEAEAASYAALAADAAAVAEATSDPWRKRLYERTANHWRHWHYRYERASSIAREDLECGR